MPLAGGTSEHRSTGPKLVPFLATRCLYGDASDWRLAWPKVKLTWDASPRGDTSELRWTGPNLVLVLPTRCLYYRHDLGQQRVFSIAFPICDYKSGSLKLVPWCTNTPDSWWKDMSKLVWRGNSPYSISIHLVHEYVMRSCRYTAANSP